MNIGCKLPIVLCGVCVILFLDAAVACKWCPPDAGPTILRQLDAAESGVLAELIRRADSNAENPVSRYRVVKVLKGALAKTGDELLVPLNVQSPEGTVHLFFGQDNSWNNPLGISSKAGQFLEMAAQLNVQSEDYRSQDRLERLEFMLPYLASPDEQIAKAAHGEFSSVPYLVLNELKSQLDHRQLVSWVQSETTFAPNRRHLFVLLGVCGNRFDYFAVAKSFDDRLANGETVDLDAIVSAMLTLGGKKALRQVQGRVFAPEVSLSAKRAAVDALRFHAERGGVIEKAKVIEIYRRLLLDPKTADFVLEDLARWKDWEALDQVLMLWETRDKNTWLRYPISEYLKACPLPQARQQIGM